jgi:hypothetical protein
MRMFGARHTIESANARTPAARRRMSRASQTPIRVLETIGRVNLEVMIETSIVLKRV